MYRSGILQAAGLASKGGDDVLVAGPHGQALHGGRGNDVLIGGSGGDYLDGGAGDETMIYLKADDSESFANFVIGVAGQRLDAADLML